MTETLNDMMKESQDIVEDIPETLFIVCLAAHVSNG